TFSGGESCNPNPHINAFLEICDTIKYNGVDSEAIRLRLFPFSLRDKAREWLHSLPPDSIRTWDDLRREFLVHFFPPSKTAKILGDITAFKQRDSETIYEAWERFKGLLRSCPNHGLPHWRQIQAFYFGLDGA
ncbi:retrotransposon gag domain-containing protein, partial [Shigella flexneri]|nr:retrotransposon gag domain-containing protein [Shigella flexneri]